MKFEEEDTHTKKTLFFNRNSRSSQEFIEREGLRKKYYSEKSIEKELKDER